MRDIWNGRIGGSIRNGNSVDGSLRDTKRIDGSVGKAEKSSERELIFKTRFEFPTVGDPQLLYIAINENQTYRWDSESKKYICVGADWHNIEVIDGGDSNG